MPYLSEPVEGTLTIRAPRGLKLYRNINASGEKQHIAVPYNNGRYVITLDKLVMTYWLFLE